MKCLIINPYCHKNTGGELCCSRNIRLLKNFYGEANIYIYDLGRYKSFIHASFLCLLGLGNGLTFKNIKEIKNLTTHLNPDVIFINSTKNGILAKILKKRKIVSFAHNVEFLFEYSNLKSVNLIQKFIFLPYLLSVYKNEYQALKYSEKIIALNKADSESFSKIYKRKADMLLPMTIEDDLTDEEVSTQCISLQNNMELPEKYMLFVGSDFYGNTQGLFWFIEQILPYTNLPIVVAGKGMDKYKEKYKDLNAHFYGFVPSLKHLYANASFVILPIISGGGMKTKTAEALMYGKSIIGTKEAFEGYNLDTAKIGAECRTAEEFITIINSLKDELPKFNSYARKIFETNFSEKAIIPRFINFFSKI